MLTDERTGEGRSGAAGGSDEGGQARRKEGEDEALRGTVYFR